MEANRPRFPHMLTTPGAQLRAVSGIDSHHLATGAFCLVLKIVDKLSPRSISNRLCQRAVPPHMANLQVFHGHNAVGMHELMRFLMTEITSTIGDTLVNVAHNFAPLRSIRGALFRFGEAALRFSQSLLIRAEEARIGNMLAVCQRGEVFEADIYASRLLTWRE